MIATITVITICARSIAIVTVVVMAATVQTILALEKLQWFYQINSKTISTNAHFHNTKSNCKAASLCDKRRLTSANQTN